MYPLATPCLPFPHSCRSADSRFNGAVHSLRVLDSRPPTGDSMAAPRVIAALPFTDTDVSSRFTDKYLYASGDPATGVRPGRLVWGSTKRWLEQGELSGVWACDAPTSAHPVSFPALTPQAGAPDVVYSFTPTTDMAVDISTCGSLYDTKLYVFEDPSNRQVGAGLWSGRVGGGGGGGGPGGVGRGVGRGGADAACVSTPLGAPSSVLPSTHQPTLPSQPPHPASTRCMWATTTTPPAPLTPRPRGSAPRCKRD